MTNIGRATRVINETYADEYVKRHMTPLKVAQALADAGLLMPDLPEPAEHDGITYFGDAPEICAYCDGQVYGLDDGVWRPTKPADLCADAAAMLAAADYAERNQE